MKFKPQFKFLSLITAAMAFSFGLVGCGNNDTPVPTAEAIKTADAKRLEYVEKQPMSESARKELESHMGGPAYQNPAIAEAMAKAKAAGGKLSPAGR